MTELKSKIVWQEDKDFGKVCTLTENALNGIINEATKELQEHHKKVCEEFTFAHRTLGEKIKDLEKEIAELEEKLANADYQLEGRDLEIRELKANLKWEQDITSELADHLGKANDKNAELKAQVTSLTMRMK